MTRWIVAVIALVMATEAGARAGSFCGVVQPVALPTTGTPTGDPVVSIAWIERFAKDRSLAEPQDLAVWLCAASDAVRLRARIVAACTVILDRDGDRSPCAMLLASAGVRGVGTHDVFAAVVADYPEKPLDAPSGTWNLPPLLAKLGDPRGATLLVETWRATLPDAERRARSAAAMESWTSWRRTAASTIGILGGADDAEFLRKQATGPVRAACVAAADAIDRRLAKP